MNEAISEIQKSIRKITDVIPEVYVREGTQNIMVCFTRIIPDEESVKKIEEALKEFGTVHPNHCRDAKFISFLISDKK